MMQQSVLSSELISSFSHPANQVLCCVCLYLYLYLSPFLFFELDRVLVECVIGIFAFFSSKSFSFASLLLCVFINSTQVNFTSHTYPNTVHYWKRPCLYGIPLLYYDDATRGCGCMDIYSQLVNVFLLTIDSIDSMEFLRVKRPTQDLGIYIWAMSIWFLHGCRAEACSYGLLLFTHIGRATPCKMRYDHSYDALVPHIIHLNCNYGLASKYINTATTPRAPVTAFKSNALWEHFAA